MSGDNSILFVTIDAALIVVGDNSVDQIVAIPAMTFSIAVRTLGRCSGSI